MTYSLLKHTLKHKRSLSILLMFVSANQQIVLASDRAPKDIKNITDRLRTSLKVECIDIQPPGMRQD